MISDTSMEWRVMAFYSKNGVKITLYICCLLTGYYQEAILADGTDFSDSFGEKLK